MGIILRESVKMSIVSYAGMILGAFNLLWLFPKLLSAEEIGLLRVLQDIPIVFVGVTHLGTLSITDKLFPSVNDHSQKHHGLLGFSLIVHLGFFVFYCVVYFFFKDPFVGLYRTNSPKIAEYISYTIPLTLMMLYQLAFNAYTRVHLRIVVSGFLSEIFLRTALALLVIIYYLSIINFSQLLLGLVGTYGFIVLALACYVYRQKIFYLQITSRLFDKSLIKLMVRFYSYIVVVGFSRILISRIDILMIPALLSTNAVGIYSIALFVGSIIDLPCRAVSQISTPIVAQAWATQEIGKIQEIYRKSAVNQLIIGGLLFLGIWCNIDSVFELMPKGDVYDPGKYVVLFIGLTRLVEMAAGVSDVIVLHSKHYLFNTVLVIALAVSLFLTNLLFIPLFFITGAALATALSVLAYTLVKCGFLWRRYRLQPFTGNSVWTLMTIMVTFLIANFMPKVEPVVVDILFRSFLIMVVFVPIIILLRVSEELNQFAVSWQRELALRIRRK